jgi:hypothetical protein
MKLKISKERTIKEIQQEFCLQYPYLKLAFYESPHGVGQVSLSDELIDPKLTIGEVGNCNKEAFIPMDGKQKVGDFEQLFLATCGLNVQVLRKSYGKWLQTWATDIWNLEEQNNRGRVMGDRRA